MTQGFERKFWKLLKTKFAESRRFYWHQRQTGGRVMALLLMLVVSATRALCERPCSASRPPCFGSKMPESRSIQRLMIIGERCSGTNFLEAALMLNFGLRVMTANKHWMGFEDYARYNNVGVVGIVRDYDAWSRSMYKPPHHVHYSLTSQTYASFKEFTTREWHSIKPHYWWEHQNGTEKELCKDRNPYTWKRIKNLSDMYAVKKHFLTVTASLLMPHYTLIRYEQLCSNYTDSMKQIAAMLGWPLRVKSHVPPGGSAKLLHNQLGAR